MMPTDSYGLPEALCWEGFWGTPIEKNIRISCYPDVICLRPQAACIKDKNKLGQAELSSSSSGSNKDSFFFFLLVPESQIYLSHDKMWKKKNRLSRLIHAAQKIPCKRICLASNSAWIQSVEIRRKHMVYISSIKKYGWEPCGTQDAITNTDTWQGLAGEDRIFLCLPDNVTGVQPTGEQSIWLWPVAPWQNVLAETLMSAWEASLSPPSRRALPPMSGADTVTG